MRLVSPANILSIVISLAVISLAAVGLGETSRRHKAADGNLWGLDRFRGGGLIRGPCARRACIALTFDDGPEHSTTPRVLDELDRRGVRATFFVVGRRFDGDGPIAERNREVLRDVWRRGHMVGNHTYTHPLMDRLDERSITREIERTDRVITETLGVRTFLFRAPYGAMQTPAARHAVYSRGLTPVFWAIDTRDWAAHSPEEVLANFRAGLDESPRGGVVLFHDTLPRTTQALPLVFDEIAARNEQRRTRGLPPYEFVGLDELWEPLRPSRAH